MSKIRLITAVFFLTAICALSAFAQTGASTGAPSKIVYVNVGAFDGDEKGAGGITKYTTAMNALDAEFKAPQAELQAMAAKQGALGAEIQALQKTPPAAVPAANQSANLTTKVDQYQQMDRDFKFKQEDLKAKFQARYGVVVGPVMEDIMKSLQDFAKQKGYSMILDASKLDQAGIILAVGNDSADVTKDFITFYNARPAGTASTGTPK